VPFAGKTFRHEIREHVFGRAIFDLDHSRFDVVTDEVELHINVLRFCMLSRVFGE
jgi:hypothetical protein